MSRDLFARKLSPIPKLLTLLDRNPTAPPMAADRFWRYKIIDFPAAWPRNLWPLALAYDTAVPDALSTVNR